MSRILYGIIYDALYSFIPLIHRFSSVKFDVYLLILHGIKCLIISCNIESVVIVEGPFSGSVPFNKAFIGNGHKVYVMAEV